MYGVRQGSLPSQRMGEGLFVGRADTRLLALWDDLHFPSAVHLCYNLAMPIHASRRRKPDMS